ncbi:MAG: malto-oligosyltrehalose trehalohydrolase [Acidimicrobiales bacterium]
MTTANTYSAPGGARYIDMPPLGAAALDSGTTSFRVWAPDTSEVRVHITEPEERWETLEKVEAGYHYIELAGVSDGALYRFVMPDGSELADPASRSQPRGVHGESEVFDASSLRWNDGGFDPLPWWRWVIYEMHTGTFSQDGTFDAAVVQLDHLVELGANAVEVMPVAQFPGRRNWGYDGVFPFAVQDSYGGPKAFQRFVDAAHQVGLAVILDVVYNHLGPEGNIFGSFGPYFTDRYRTPWGPAVNFDGDFSDEVRRFFVTNALWWFSAFHVDALRLDAVHSIFDTTARPFLLELGEATDELATRSNRPLHLIAESADNNPKLVTPASEGGTGIGAQWNDDFHHALHAAVTGERFGYYADFGTLDQLARSISEGFVLQGQYSEHRKRHHGASSVGIAPDRLVIFDQNHDQIGNRPRGERLSQYLDVEKLRLCAAVLLLSPGVPMLFMGEEYAEDAPFPYFVDHDDPDLLEAVRRGRTAEMMSLGLDEEPLDPIDPATFQMARLDLGLVAEGDHARVWNTYRGLLATRTSHPVLGRAHRFGNVADVCSPGVLRMVRRAWSGPEQLVAFFNFSSEAARIVAPRTQALWRKVIDSASPELGGTGDTLPEKLNPDDHTTIGASGFCAYGS